MLGPEEGHLTGLEKAREGSLEGECEGHKAENDIPGGTAEGVAFLKI